jgi:hypothetical protein
MTGRSRDPATDPQASTDGLSALVSRWLFSSSAPTRVRAPADAMDERGPGAGDRLEAVA